MEVLFRRLEPEAKVNVAADRMVAIVRLDRAGEGIGGEVRADAGFHIAEQLDIAGVADRVRADPESTAVGLIEPLLDLRLAAKQLVFVHELRAACQKVFTT